MGLRGPGAKAIRRPVEPSVDTPAEPHPWDAPGLARWQRVRLFVESLPVTSGPLAGTKFKLRPWQQRIVRALYRADDRGRRLVRTAVVSMARKNGKTDIGAQYVVCRECYKDSEPEKERGWLTIDTLGWLTNSVSGLMKNLVSWMTNIDAEDVLDLLIPVPLGGWNFDK